MWQCLKCHKAVEETFDVCWNCGTARDGTEDPSFRKDEDSVQDETEHPSADPIFCLRCNRKLDFVGTKKFHEGTRAWDVIGGIWELFKNREHFDVYVCPRCGRVEFFVDRVGEEFRPH